jgi:four helix bundle protein
METKKIQSFTDLETWRQAHLLVLLIYKITKTFPKSEIYCLIDQMRRCAISISSNIAEGFSKQSKKEKLQFYYMAKASLTELQNQLLVARDVGYISNKTFQEVAEKTIVVHRLLNGLIRSIKFQPKIPNTKY